MTSDSDPFKLLGVERGSGEQSIRKAYRAAAIRCHPDRGGDVEQFHRLKRYVAAAR